MQLKKQIEWNESVNRFLKEIGIQNFDWASYHKEKQKANLERLSKMTLEEQEEELSNDVKKLEDMLDIEDIYDLRDSDIDWFNNDLDYNY